MKKTAVFSVLSTVLFSAMSLGTQAQQECIIEDFAYERDIKDVLQIIKDDWNSLFKSTRPAYDEDYLLQNEVPGKEFAPEKYDGKFKMKVARKEGRIAGFVSFYEQDASKGRIRIISIAQDCKDMGYDEKLTIAAIKELVDSGCTSILLWTRKDNEKVAMYEGLGFQELGLSDDDITWFEEKGINSEEYTNYTKYELKK